MPRVFNIKHGNVPKSAKYCGRGSPVGNPFVIGRDGTREEVIEKFKCWAPTQPKVMEAIHALRGHDLSCFCKPKACHCDWILEVANA